MFDENRALALLRQGAGRADAVFRDGQEDAIRHLVDALGNDDRPDVAERHADIFGLPAGIAADQHSSARVPHCAQAMA